MADQRCRDCVSRDLRVHYSDGDVVCHGCGLVAEERLLDERAEWRSFADREAGQDDPARCGAPSTAWESACMAEEMVTVVGAPGDLQRMQRRMVGSVRKAATTDAVFDMNHTCSLMNVPDPAIKLAGALFSSITRQRGIKGDHRRAVMAACVYHACQSSHIPKTLCEVANAFTVPVSKFAQASTEALFHARNHPELRTRFLPRGGAVSLATEDKHDVLLKRMTLEYGARTGLPSGRAFEVYKAARSLKQRAMTNVGSCFYRKQHVTANVACIWAAAKHLQALVEKDLCQHFAVQKHSLERHVADLQRALITAPGQSK